MFNENFSIQRHFIFIFSTFEYGKLCGIACKNCTDWLVTQIHVPRWQENQFIRVKFNSDPIIDDRAPVLRTSWVELDKNSNYNRMELMNGPLRLLRSSIENLQTQHLIIF